MQLNLLRLYCRPPLAAVYEIKVEKNVIRSSLLHAHLAMVDNERGKEESPFHIFVCNEQIDGQTFVAANS